MDYSRKGESDFGQTIRGRAKIYIGAGKPLQRLLLLLVDTPEGEVKISYPYSFSEYVVERLN